MTSAPPRLPSLYIPHGAGPCFFIPPMPGFPADLWDPMAGYLRAIAAGLPHKPEALLVISAHWEAEVATINAAAHPPLLFDYAGFPASAYQLTYPAPGSPPLAAKLRERLRRAGIASEARIDRGLDHGVFIPLKLVFPQADLPVVQLSLNANLDPGTHLALGRALAPLRSEGVLIIATGMSYHNLAKMFANDARANAPAIAFDHWLSVAVTHPDPGEREARLARWSEAPGARDCHPRSEHLIPLMVAAGAAESDPGRCSFNDVLMGKPLSGFQFG